MDNLKGSQAYTNIISMSFEYGVGNGLNDLIGY